VIYVFWMLIYILALPVWNLVLPVYAFWHFDDFSWGETRKVEGEGKGQGHGDGKGQANTVPLRRWEDWERSRLRKLKREERRRKELERVHPGEFLSARADTRSQYDSSDTLSVFSSEDDHWGAQIGGYNENNAQYPPPPTGLLLPQNAALQHAKTVGASELEAMLETGFDAEPSRSSSPIGVQPNTPRYQLSDGPARGYAPLTRDSPPIVGSPTTPTLTSGSEWSRESPRGQRTPVQRYGPLGPLDPSGRF
jgi:chitin synthase